MILSLWIYLLYPDRTNTRSGMCLYTDMHATDRRPLLYNLVYSKHTWAGLYTHTHALEAKTGHLVKKERRLRKWKTNTAQIPQILRFTLPSAWALAPEHSQDQEGLGTSERESCQRSHSSSPRKDQDMFWATNTATHHIARGLKIHCVKNLAPSRHLVYKVALKKKRKGELIKTSTNDDL